MDSAKTKFKLYQFAFTLVLVFSVSHTYAQIENLNFDKLSKPEPQVTENIDNLEKSKSINTDDLIHIGDLIDVDIIGSTEYDWRGKITNEGFLDGIEFTDDEVYGLCKTGDEVANVIAKSYGKFLRNPKIVVTIVDRSNRPVTTLFGAVKKPQKFQIKRKVNLNELIVLSGGFTEKTSGMIQIIRQPNTSCVTKINDELANKKKSNEQEFIKVKQEKGAKYINIKISDLLSGVEASNLQILYGDIITVKIAEPIYVIGGVVAPSKLQIRESTTVTKAIASAGGLTETADSENIRVFRRVDGKTKIIKINLSDIADNKGNDVKLKAYDIVDVKEKGRNEKKYPPVIRFDDFKNTDILKLPLTIID